MNKRNKRPLLKAAKFQKQFSFCSHLNEINEKVVIKEYKCRSRILDILPFKYFDMTIQV